MLSLRTLAKILQFLSSCIIIVEIVGEERLKLATGRSAERLKKRRRPDLRNKMDLRLLRLWNRIDGSKPLSMLVGLCVIVVMIVMYRWFYPDEANGFLSLIGRIVVVVPCGLATVSLVWMIGERLIIALSLTFDVIYDVLLRAIAQALDHDKAKRRLLMLSFILLIAGTTLDIIEE